MLMICGPNQMLTRDQVAQYMRNAGFPENAIPTGLAVAQAESSLESGNCNTSDPYGGSFGLWQINGAHFDSGETSKECAFDAQCATNFAYKLWQQNGWQPWGAYTNGSYKQYTNGGNQSGNEQPLSTTGKCPCPPNMIDIRDPNGTLIGCKDPNNPFGSYLCHATTIPSGTEQLQTILDAVGPWLQKPTRIIKLLFGVVLIGGAIFLLVSPQGQLLQQASKFSRQAGLSRLQGASA
jgi:Lysozyme like domain